MANADLEPTDPEETLEELVARKRREQGIHIEEAACSS